MFKRAFDTGSAALKIIGHVDDHEPPPENEETDEVRAVCACNWFVDLRTIFGSWSYFLSVVVYLIHLKISSFAFVSNLCACLIAQITAHEFGCWFFIFKQ